MTDRSISAMLWLYVRSFFSVIAGLVVVVALSSGIDEMLHSAGIIPRGAMWNPWHNLLALAYRCAIGVVGGFVTAWLAPQTPMRHVTILAVIGTLAAIAGILVSWNMNLAPHWYPIALAVTAFPTVWLGGWLQMRRAHRL